MKHVLPPPRLPSGQTDSNRFRDYTDDGGNGTWRHDLMGWWAVVQVHGPILAILAIFSRAPAVWTFVVAFLVVANRQHAMLLLGHETWHLSLFRSRAVNRVIGAWFCFYPMVMRYTLPRLAHLEHHRMVGRQGDPYGYFWNFGADERKAFLAQVLSIATGLVFVRTLVGTVAGTPVAAGGAEGAGSFRRRPPSPHEMPNAVHEPRELIHVAATHICILAAFSLSIGWVWYFVLWLMPAVTLGSATDFIRNWAEHRHGDLIIYRSSSLERLLFAPLNFNMHAVHHVFPAEPWFRLPALEQRARDDTPGVRECQSYLGEVIRYLKGTDTGTTPTDDG